jgi:CHAD domain-containing protein
MPPRPVVHSLLLSRSAAQLDLLPAARAGDSTAIHQARVASRRLREVLAAVRRMYPGDAASRAGRDVRRVTRALGEVRELDVSLRLFDELLVAHPIDAAAQMAVRRSLTAARSAANRDARTALSPSKVTRLREGLATLGEAVGQTPPRDMRDAVGARVAHRGARLLEALHRAGAIYVPARLHAVRIAVKQLRYALEVSGDATSARVAPRLRELKAVQELLGRAHDLHVLEQRLLAVQIQTVRTSRRTAREIGRLARAVDQACRELHAAFMSRRPALAALASALAPASPARRSRSAA